MIASQGERRGRGESGLFVSERRGEPYVVPLLCLYFRNERQKNGSFREGGGTGTSRKILGTRGRRKIDGDKAELIRPKNIIFPVGSGHFCTFKSGRTTTYYVCDYVRRIYNRPLFPLFFVRPIKKLEIAATRKRSRAQQRGRVQWNAQEKVSS